MSDLLKEASKHQLEITNWPKQSQTGIIVTILIALLGYGFTWYIDRQERLEQIQDERVRFERQQIQDSINRKIEIYDKVENSISNIRRIWYLARAKCAYDQTYATNPKKIEEVNLQRWSARIDLMGESYKLSLKYPETSLEKEIYEFNTWESGIRNICSPDSPSGEIYREKQAAITKSMIAKLVAEQKRLLDISTKQPTN